MGQGPMMFQILASSPHSMAYYSRYGRRKYGTIRRTWRRGARSNGIFSGAYARRYVTGYGGKIYRQLGLRARGPSANYNQVFRVVFAPVDVICIPNGAKESGTTEVGNLSMDVMYQLFSSANWATEIVARYGSIMPKAFAFTRQILAV